VKASLSRYFAVVQNRKPAKFKLSQKVPAEFDPNDSLEKLWLEHQKRTAQYFRIEQEKDAASSYDSLSAPEKSYFNLKLEIARRILSNCHFCSRRCQTNRTLGQIGFCGCSSDDLAVSSIFAHLGEEPELVPSGTIFTMGCTIQCKHCQNWTISQWKEKGETLSPQRLAPEIDRLHLEGCKNINLVGGEPTPWLFQWLQTFKHVKANVPVVWNSNSYYSFETAQLLAGFADVYLLDFKYGPGDCAGRIANAPNYGQACTANHLEAKRYGELIVRLLVLPNHLDCCVKPILEWIAENLGADTRVNVMFQYRPEWRAYEIPELRRTLTKTERNQALRLAKSAGLENLVT
jgi:putative pyruvate formate lyase activating enzyme